MNHTPTPWKYQTEVTREYSKPDAVRHQIYTQSGKFGNPATCLLEKDAIFIVTACNAHEDLLKACKLAVAHLVEGGIQDFMRKAIAKAEAQS